MSQEPICVACGKAMRAELNGIFAVYKDRKGNCEEGIMCDKWRCYECGYEILSGFAQDFICKYGQEEWFDQFVKGKEKAGEVVYWSRD